MFKKFATFIVLLSATSLVLVQTQQSAQASFLGDVGKFLGVYGNAVDGLDDAIQPDGSVDAGKLIKTTGKYFRDLDREFSDAPQPKYQTDAESHPDQIEQAEEPDIQQAEAGEESELHPESDASQDSGDAEASDE
jgi:hypothetical protein